MTENEMTIPKACEKLIEIAKYADAGRLNKDDYDKACELVGFINKFGPFFCEQIFSKYVETGMRVKEGDRVAVKDDHGNATVLTFIAPYRLRYLAASRS